MTYILHATRNPMYLRKNCRDSQVVHYIRESDTDQFFQTLEKTVWKKKKR